MSTAKRVSGLQRLFLLVLVSISGGVVLALEVLGTRVIGVWYGSSLYVWAALLSVTLVCLAVGYAIGGRLADRYPRASVLCGMVMGAGASVLLVPPLSAALGPLSIGLGLAAGAIASAFLVFFLPLTILAMASPYVIRLLSQRVEGVGAVSGTVYALSTVGSVAGVLVVSLWMIPVLGTRVSIQACAGVLLALGAVGLGVFRTPRAALLIILTALPWFVPYPDDRVPGQIYQTESPFGELRVIQRDEPGRGIYRMLMVNGIMQTGMPLDISLVGPGDLLQSDHYLLELLPYYYPDLGAGRTGILIGLAGGMFARVMEFYHVDLTAVEIDVQAVELAQAYFGYRGQILDTSGQPYQVDLSRFPNREVPAANSAVVQQCLAPPADIRTPYRGRAVIQDGRRYLITHPETVDFIVLDAYNSDAIPSHLITREFFELVRARLQPDGILMINYIGRPEGDFVTDALFRTLGSVFGTDMIQAYRTRSERDEVQVMAVFAFLKPMELLPHWGRQDFSSGVDELSYELSQRRESAARSHGIIITDDLNPIDRARVETAWEWRRQTRHWVGGDAAASSPRGPTAGG